MGEPSQALVEDEKAISIDPGFVRAWISGGRLWKNKGDFAVALNAFDKAIPQEPSSAAEAVYLKGNLLRSMKSAMQRQLKPMQEA